MSKSEITLQCNRERFTLWYWMVHASPAANRIQCIMRENEHILVKEMNINDPSSVTKKVK
jgi:hypothetical protein